MRCNVINNFIFHEEQVSFFFLCVRFFGFQQREITVRVNELWSVDEPL